MKRIKKSIFTFGICLLTTANIFAQTEVANVAGNSPKFVYCDMVGTQRFLSTKITISLDFGQARNIWKDNRVKDEVTGKAQSFNSMVDALNYMGEQGWELAQAYVVNSGEQNVYHWLLKKKKED